METRRVKGRDAVYKAIGEAVKAYLQIQKAVDSIRNSLLKAVEDALNIPLTPETAMIRRLYSFSKPYQPSLDELYKLISKYMGLKEGEDIVNYIKSLSSNSPRSFGARGQRHSRRNTGNR